MPTTPPPAETPIVVATLAELAEGVPVRACAAEVELVVVRRGEEVHVLSGRCPHRRAHMADGSVEGNELVCASHGWEFDLVSGESRTVPGECLAVFSARIDRERGVVVVVEQEILRWKLASPDPFKPGEYLGH